MSPTTSSWKLSIHLNQSLARVSRDGFFGYNHTLHVIYKPGKENIADTLSRLPRTDEGKNFDDTENYVNFITVKAVPKAMSAKEIEEVALNDKEMECLR